MMDFDWLIGNLVVDLLQVAYEAHRQPRAC